MHALVGEDLSVDAEPSPVSVVSPYQSLGLYGSGAIAISSFILLSISSRLSLFLFFSLVSFSFFLFFFFRLFSFLFCLYLFTRSFLSLSRYSECQPFCSQLVILYFDSYPNWYPSTSSLIFSLIQCDSFQRVFLLTNTHANF
jgi:hypothetical protein